MRRHEPWIFIGSRFQLRESRYSCQFVSLLYPFHCGLHPERLCNFDTRQSRDMTSLSHITFGTVMHNLYFGAQPGPGYLIIRSNVARWSVCKLSGLQLWVMSSDMIKVTKNVLYRPGTNLLICQVSVVVVEFKGSELYNELDSLRIITASNMCLWSRMVYIF